MFKKIPVASVENEVNFMCVEFRNEARNGNAQGICRRKYEHKPKVHRKNNIEYAFEAELKVFRYTVVSKKK